MTAGIRMGAACASLMLLMACGCQINNATTEIRSDEQMLPISFENEQAKDLFMNAAQSTYGQEQNVKRIGFPGLSVYSRDETVAWNANCNDHIRAMDANGDLLITEQEAVAHCNLVASAKTK